MKVTCPLCRRVSEIAKMDELKYFPFCSERCKLVDLGRWIDGDYAIGTPTTGEPEDAEEEPMEIEDEDD